MLSFSRKGAQHLRFLGLLASAPASPEWHVGVCAGYTNLYTQILGGLLPWAGPGKHGEGTKRRQYTCKLTHPVSVSLPSLLGSLCHLLYNRAASLGLRCPLCRRQIFSTLHRASLSWTTRLSPRSLNRSSQSSAKCLSFSLIFCFQACLFVCLFAKEDKCPPPPPAGWRTSSWGCHEA